MCVFTPLGRLTVDSVCFGVRRACFWIPLRTCAVVAFLFSEFCMSVFGSHFALALWLLLVLVDLNLRLRYGCFHSSASCFWIPFRICVTVAFGVKEGLAGEVHRMRTAPAVAL